MPSWPHLYLALVAHEPDPAREKLALRLAAGYAEARVREARCMGSPRGWRIAVWGVMHEHMQMQIDGAALTIWSVKILRTCCAAGARSEALLLPAAGLIPRIRESASNEGSAFS